jgi:hypothetical protein
MTFTRNFFAALRAGLEPSRAPRRTSKRLSIGAAMAAFALTAIFIAPPAPPSAAEQLQAYVTAHAQSLAVEPNVAATDVARDAYAATAGIDSLVASGTNYDWAKLVLMSGGWPMSNPNVTVLVRWMRQENGPTSWWNRNNPLNNGLGSGGGGGTGSYPNLMVAAQKAAENLHRNPSFGTIAASLAASAPTDITEQAIWASPWASSHYGNGSRWHYSPVPVVKAPGSAW